jgi:hypothetical protein
MSDNRIILEDDSRPQTLMHFYGQRVLRQADVTIDIGGLQG